MEEGLFKDQVDALKEADNKRAKAYKTVFTTPAGKIVLDDLKTICAINVPTGPQSVEQANYINGAQSVYFRVVNYLEKKLDF